MVQLLVGVLGSGAARQESRPGLAVRARVCRRLLLIQKEQQLRRRYPFALMLPSQKLSEPELELAVASHELAEDGE
jgi:hypothetical protein